LIVLGDAFRVIVAVGLLGCLILTPISYLFVSETTVWFAGGALVFFLLGLVASRNGREPEPENDLEAELVDSLRRIDDAGRGT